MFEGAADKEYVKMYDDEPAYKNLGAFVKLRVLQHEVSTPSFFDMTLAKSVPTP